MKRPDTSLPTAVILSELVPNIDFEFKIRMSRMDGYVRVQMDAAHNLYPAYEAIVGQSDGTYVPVWQYKPPSAVFPGPLSLNTEQRFKSREVDVQ